MKSGGRVGYARPLGLQNEIHELRAMPFTRPPGTTALANEPRDQVVVLPERAGRPCARADPGSPPRRNQISCLRKRNSGAGPPMRHIHTCSFQSFLTWMRI